MKYVCNICGYVYDEDEKGRPFSELEDYECPLCGADRSDFSEEG